MTETKRIATLFSNLYDGKPWLDVTLVDTLSSISAQQAAAKKYPTRNSIWEITNHLIAWRHAVLQRIQGNPIPSPEHNFILPITDSSDQAWQKTIRELKNSQQQWIQFLHGLEDAALSDVSPQNGHTHYEHIHGIIQHDAYHLGQIVLLAKHPE